jgi:hypothetical protein
MFDSTWRIVMALVSILAACITHAQSSKDQQAQTYPNTTRGNPWNLVVRYLVQFDDTKGNWGGGIQFGSDNSSTIISAPWTLSFTLPQQVKITKISSKYTLNTDRETVKFTFKQSIIEGTKRSVIVNFTGTYDITADPVASWYDSIRRGPSVVYWTIPRDYGKSDVELGQDDMRVGFIPSVIPVSTIPLQPSEGFLSALDSPSLGSSNLGSLSIGAIVGIAVGSAAVLGAVLGTVAYRNHQRRRVLQDLATNPSYGI